MTTTKVRKTFYIEEKQWEALNKRAAEQQMKTGQSVSASDVARDVIDAGLATLQPVTQTASPTLQEQ
jgi:hypothetical protein